jgi:hypothetical protein
MQKPMLISRPQLRILEYGHAGAPSCEDEDLHKN